MKFYLINEEQLQQLIDGLYNPMAKAMRDLVKEIKMQNPPALPIPPEASKAYERTPTREANEAHEEEEETKDETKED